MKLKIITAPNPILRQKSRPVEKIDQKVKNLAQAMIQLVSPNGQAAPDGKTDPGQRRTGEGLSAIQVGKPIRLFILYLKDRKKFQVFINPKIIRKSQKFLEDVTWLEGCLSVPGIYATVLRHQWIKLRYQTLEGQTKTEKFSHFLATVIQHECDHLQGVLFVDRVLEQKGKLYQLEKTSEGEELAEVKLDH